LQQSTPKSINRLTLSIFRSIIDNASCSAADTAVCIDQYLLGPEITDERLDRRRPPTPIPARKTRSIQRSAPPPLGAVTVNEPEPATVFAAFCAVVSAPAAIVFV
jgi:hypothetical protein